MPGRSIHMNELYGISVSCVLYSVLYVDAVYSLTPSHTQISLIALVSCVEYLDTERMYGAHPGHSNNNVVAADDDHDHDDGKKISLKCKSNAPAHNGKVFCRFSLLTQKYSHVLKSTLSVRTRRTAAHTSHRRLHTYSKHDYQTTTNAISIWFLSFSYIRPLVRSISFARFNGSFMQEITT